MTGSNNKKASYIDKSNPVEIIGELVGGVASQAANELSRGLFESTLDQIGIPKQSGIRSSFSGEIKIGGAPQTLEIKTQATEHKVSSPDRQFTYVRRSEQVVLKEESAETEKRIRELVMQISMEVKSLQFQTAALSGDIGKIPVQEITKKPGLYHLNFFEWVVTMLRDLKKEVVKSRTWLGVFNSKKAKKGYWSMFKKHGTSFAMSDERSLATSAG